MIRKFFGQRKTYDKVRVQDMLPIILAMDDNAQIKIVNHHLETKDVIDMKIGVKDGIVTLELHEEKL